jgi:hypothetical protein
VRRETRVKRKTPEDMYVFKGIGCLKEKAMFLLIFTEKQET